MSSLFYINTNKNDILSAIHTTHPRHPNKAPPYFPAKNHHIFKCLLLFATNRTVCNKHLHLLRFFVIIYGMLASTKNFNKKSILVNKVLEFFLLFIALVAVAVFSFMVFRQVQKLFTPVQNADPVTEITKTSLSHDVNPQDYQKLAVTYAQKDDMGLNLYRDEQNKPLVEAFYTYITGSEIVTNAILAAADQNNIPLSLAFSLAYIESRYKSRAVNVNKNSSIDRGLFQLNSNSFPKLSEREFFDPEINSKMGLQHLRFCLDTAGNEVAALAMYNAGTTKVKTGTTPQKTLNYVSKIIEYKNGLDAIFSNQVVAKVQNTGNDIYIALLTK